MFGSSPALTGRLLHLFVIRDNAIKLSFNITNSTQFSVRFCHSAFFTILFAADVLVINLPDQ